MAKQDASEPPLSLAPSSVLNRCGVATHEISQLVTVCSQMVCNIAQNAKQLELTPGVATEHPVTAAKQHQICAHRLIVLLMHGCIVTITSVTHTCCRACGSAPCMILHPTSDIGRDSGLSLEPP